MEQPRPKRHADQCYLRCINTAKCTDYQAPQKKATNKDARTAWSSTFTTTVIEEQHLLVSIEASPDVNSS